MDQKTSKDDAVVTDAENDNVEEDNYEEEAEESGSAKSSKPKDEEFQLEIDGVPQSVQETADNVSSQQQSKKEAQDDID